MENQKEKHQNNTNEKKKMTTKKDDSGYTPQEEQFADGKGT